MLDIKNWKEFKLLDIFPTFERGKRLVEYNREPGDIPLVTAGYQNEGVADFISNLEQKRFKNKITIDMFCNVFYRDYVFCCDDNIIVLINDELNLNVCLFVVSVIRKDKFKFAYGRQYRQKDLLKHIIKLPADSDGNPDYKFMNDYIEELQSRESKGNIKDSIITNNVSHSRAIKTKGWKAFKIKEIFKIYTGKDLIYSTIIPGDYDVVGHGKENLGLVAKTELLDGYPLFDNQKTISLADRGNFYATARPFPFYVGTRVKALTYKYDDADLYSLMFIANIINMEEYRFTYGRNSTNKLPELEIKLPVNENGLPNCAYMSKIIRSLPYADRI